MIYKYPYKSIFKLVRPFDKIGNLHFGVDLVGESKEIFPIAEGFVLSINSKNKGFGNHVLIKQNDGKIALYAHLKSVNVEILQEVTFDTLIGIEGDTGNAKTSHLHLELHDKAFKNPKYGKKSSWILDPLQIISLHETHWAKEYLDILVSKNIIENADKWSDFDSDLSTKTVGELLAIIAKSL